jgi:hypothetical protein
MNRTTRLSKGLMQSYYTIFHPVNGFDAVKWENAGSIKSALLIVFLFFLVNVFDAELVGFIYNTHNPDRISILSIFAVSVGGILLWFISNWAVSSLMFTEGKTKHIFLLTCYTLLPYTIWEFFYIIASNIVASDMAPFLQMLRFIGFGWSLLLLIFGTYQIHQVTAGKVFIVIFLTALGVLIMLFLMLLAYSLVQQMYIFGYTIFNEIVFRL